MYLDHYGLKETPFSITPDPRFVFLSDRHRDALAHLIYGISQGGGGGFVQLTGEVGTGKTTLSRLLLEQLPENTRVALVLNPRLDPVELLEAICHELHLDTTNVRGSIRGLVDTLNRYLLEAHAQHLKVVLILDEAQQLSVDALEQVRLLTNLETATDKLLQIVLLGQPELRDLLERPDLRQLAQRITARFHLTPLNEIETAEYVKHRLAVAGLARSPFTERGLAALHRRSGGVPRLINVIGERALLAGYARDLDHLDARAVNSAADELLPARSRWAPWPGRRNALAIAAACLAAVAIAVPVFRNVDPSTLSPTAAIATAPPPGPQQPTLASLLATGHDDTAAATALLARWQGEPALGQRIDDCPFLLDTNHLYCVRTRGTFAQLKLLDRPVLLFVPVARHPAWIGLLSLDDESATVNVGGNQAVVTRAELDALWPGEYLALMRLPAAVEPARGANLPAWALQALSHFESNRSLPPLSDPDDRVRRLQQMYGLRADALVGPETWWVLSAHLDGGPRLGASAMPTDSSR
jgi:general secretion pathway protein A